MTVNSMIQLAFSNSYALALKHRKGLPGTGKAAQRLCIFRMKDKESLNSLANPEFKAYWFFDDQIHDTLVMALADAITCGSPWYEVERVMKLFNLHKPRVDVVIKHLLFESEIEHWMINSTDKKGSPTEKWFARVTSHTGEEVIVEEENLFGLLVELRYHYCEKRDKLEISGGLLPFQFFEDMDEEFTCEHDWEEITMNTQNGVVKDAICNKCSAVRSEEEEDSVTIEVEIEDLKSEVQSQVG